MRVIFRFAPLPEVFFGAVDCKFSHKDAMMSFGLLNGCRSDSKYFKVFLKLKKFPKCLRFF